MKLSSTGETFSTETSPEEIKPIVTEKREFDYRVKSIIMAFSIFRKKISDHKKGFLNESSPKHVRFSIESPFDEIETVVTENYVLDDQFDTIALAVSDFWDYKDSDAKITKRFLSRFILYQCHIPG